jgi:RHS repeat-associated protein
MSSAPRRPDPLLPLTARQQAQRWTRWFHYSVMLSLVAGLMAFAPLQFTGADGELSWWPFGGDAERPQSESVDVAAGDGTADMDPGWDPELPESAAAPAPGQIQTPLAEAEPQSLRLETVGGAAPAGYVEGVSKERVSERTESTTVFDNPDGTQTLRVYQGDAFVEDENGALVPVDATLERDGNGRWMPEAAADVSFAPAANDSDIIRFNAGEGAISYGMTGAAPVTATAEGHQVTYPEILPATDLRFTVAGWGAKADIILDDASAAVTWTFPLTLDAVSVEVDKASGAVLFRNDEGEAVAAVPAGFAEDSDVDPASGEGDRTYDLEYSIVQAAEGPALRVALDEDWFTDPDRVFPVTVDPTLSDANGLTSGDTYVQKPYTNNFSGEGEIKVGYVDGNTSAGLLKFDTAMDALQNKYIRGATLSLYNTYSWSCSARTVKVHRITESWSANSSMSWPGPAFDATAEASKSFAHGYSSSCGDAWETFTLDRETVTEWSHGTESFYGFRLEASHTDEKGYKRFASRQTDKPGASPFIDVVYSDQGASYALPSGGFTTAVTAASAGTVPVTVTNWGSATWKAGTGYHLRVQVVDLEGKAVRGSEGPFYAPKDVAPHASATFTATVAALPPGKYKLQFTMVDPNGTWFTKSPYSIPISYARFDVVNLPPQINGNSPGDGAVIDSIQPSLWVKFNDVDSPIANARYEYKICRGPEGDTTDCSVSAQQTAAAWKIPANFLTWGKTVYWYARVSDGTATSVWTPAIELTPQPAQPPVTSHLAGASDGSTVPGLNPQIGNFTTAVTDAEVAAVGPALAAQRTYNSQDLRTTGAFGTGWSTPWDQKLTVEAGSTILVVLDSGRTVRFGKNPDGTFDSPLGESLELAATASGYRMRDTAGDVREFNAAGQLVRIIDAFGRGQTLTYTSGKLTTVTDDISGRSLTLQWTGTHITAVVVPPAQTGGASTRWTYTYTGDQLTKACSPLSTVDCTSYTYEATSFYEAAVQDANPKAYYTFDGIGISETVANRAADIEGEDDATGTGLLHTPVGGGLAASDGRALDLGANPASAATLPPNLLTGSATIGVELWFRAEPGERGIIFSVQKGDDPTASPGCAIPMLYIGTDGLLHSGLWADSGADKKIQLNSTARVDDGAWHHVALTTAVTQQTLYLDGAQADTESGRSLDQINCGLGIIGRGWGNVSWAAMSAASEHVPYGGELDDLSFYTRTLTTEEIAARYRAGANGIGRMNSLVNDQGHTVWQIDYDRTTGRVSALTDVNAASWTLSDPILVDSDRRISLSSSYGKSEQYVYDASHNGRLDSRTDAIGTATWVYNDAGFISAHQDEVGLVTEYTTDDHGRRTSVKTCRAEADCATSYTAYYESTDPFNLRRGRVVWERDGRSASSTDSAYATGYTYNTQGQLLTTTSPGSSTSSTNPKGIVTNTYTTGSEAAVGGGTVPAGLTATVTDQTGGVTTYAYYKSGDLAETVTAAGQVTRYGYDLLGRLISTQIGSYSGSQFTARDTVTETLDALGNTLTRTGQAFTNPVTGNTHRLQQTFTYDQYGRLDSTSSWDEAKPTQVRTTGYDYDAAGHLIATQFPDGSVKTQRWNNAGLLATETTATGLELSYAYDERGRLLTTSAVGDGVDPADPASTELLLEYRTYYDNDWAASVTDALGRKTSWEYWGDGTVKRDLHTAPDGTETVTAQYEYDNALNPAKTTDAVGTITQTNYNSRNWPTSTVIDPAGAADATHFAYDKAGRTTSLTYKYGGVTYKVDTFNYNSAGSVTSAITTAATVEGECRVEDNRSCVVAKTASTYNSEGLLASTQTGNDGAETYTYNSLGQPQTVTGASRDVWVDGVDQGTQTPVTTYGYNAFGELTHLKDAAGNITETAYDTSGRPVLTLLPAEIAAGSNVPVQPQITTAYRPGGLVESETDPRGATTAYTYDRYGRTLTVTNPDPDGSGAQTAPVTTYTYDRAGQLLETIDPTGALATATYDSFGRTATVSATERTETDPAYFTTSYTYDNAGKLLTETAPSGAQTAYTYDALGRTRTVTDPAGVATTYTYPAATTTRATFADGGDGTARRQSSITDVLGNPVKITSETDTGAGWTTVQCAQTRYDLSGRPIAETTVQHATCTTPDTTYTYDSAGQVTAITGAVTDTSAITVALGYDQLGHQTRMVDGNGNTTVYGFNDWGLQDTTVEPATTTAPDLADRTWTTLYDLAGNAVEQHLPGGVTQTAEYDLLGRKTTETGTGAEATTTIKHYTWDGVGNLTGFSSDLGDTTVDYNDRGLITALTGTQTSTYEYNGDGQVIERTDAAGTTAFTYDKGRLKTLADPLTNTTNTYQWRGDGQLASITAGSATRSVTYGGYGQLTGDTLTAGNQTKSIAYTYDGQLLASTTTSGLPNAGTQTYGYDQQGRLTSWTDATGVDTTYTWDGNSNRIAVNRWDTECGDQAATTRLYVYDERNQLTEAMDGPLQCVQSGGTWQTQTTVPAADETWTYTPRGTTATHTDTEDVTTNYAFDAFEQLKTVTVGSDAVVNQYDALGRLIARNGNTGFAYDGLTNNLTAAPNGSGIDRIVRDPAGGTVSQTHGGITGFSWTNTHGDLVGIINPTTGDLIAGGGLGPFGNLLPDTTDTTIGFQGGYTDPTTGEVNAHARWYNPETGAFTSRDTWQLDPSPVPLTNRYLYGNASPLNHADASGHFAQVVAAPIVVVGGTLLGGYILGQAIKECYEHRCNGAFKRSTKKAWNNVEDWWEDFREGNNGNYGTRNRERTNWTERVYVNRGKGTGNPGGKGAPGVPGGNGGGGCPGCGGGNGGGGGGGNPWSPPRSPIDWNALETRPDDTAQDAADDAPDENDLLNDALMENEPIRDKLEDLGIISVDENGEVTNINWQNEEDQWDTCKDEQIYLESDYVADGSAPGRRGGYRANGAAAFLCNTVDGTDASGSIKPWDWPENNRFGNKTGRSSRCHLLGRTLGGSGTDRDNLVTCFQQPTNSPNMSRFEMDVREAVNFGENIIYISVPQYNGYNGSLSGISVVAVGDRGYYAEECFVNSIFAFKGAYGNTC